jgi:hypothetical protein
MPVEVKEFHREPTLVENFPTLGGNHAREDCFLSALCRPALPDVD